MHHQTSRVVTACSALLTASLFLACAAPPSDGDSNNGGSGGKAATSNGGNAPANSGGNSGGSPASGNGGSAGGSGGSAPAASSDDCTAPAATAMLSDFEGGTAKVADAEGRSGSWFIFDDGTGTVKPVKVANMPLPTEGPGACNSMYAFHLVGEGLKGFGAGIGTDLGGKTAAGARAPYDISAYKGVAFRAKASKPTFVHVSIADKGTATEGGVCEASTVSTNKKRCGDYFGGDVSVTTQWKTFVLPFAQMVQRGFGLPVTTGFDAKNAYTFRAQSKGNATAPASFDIWFDDVHFVK